MNLQPSARVYSLEVPMHAPNAGELFAAAADVGEVDTLVETESRLWVGLLPVG